MNAKLHTSEMKVMKKGLGVRAKDGKITPGSFMKASKNPKKVMVNTAKMGKKPVKASKFLAMKGLV